MTRATFAAGVGKEVGVPVITILTALSILASTLPQLILLCQPTEPEPLERSVKRLCVHRKVVARRRIKEALPEDARRKIATAEAMRKRIASMSEQNIKALLEG